MLKNEQLSGRNEETAKVKSKTKASRKKENLRRERAEPDESRRLPGVGLQEHSSEAKGSKEARMRRPASSRVAVQTLKVPTQSKARSNSLDATTTSGSSSSLLRVPGQQYPAASSASEECCRLISPLDRDGDGGELLSSLDTAGGVQKSNRSRSVDISLPTRPGDPYEVCGRSSGSAASSETQECPYRSTAAQATRAAAAASRSSGSMAAQILRPRLAASSASLANKRRQAADGGLVFAATTVVDLISGREWQFEDARK